MAYVEVPVILDKCRLRNVKEMSGTGTCIAAALLLTSLLVTVSCRVISTCAANTQRLGLMLDPSVILRCFYKVIYLFHQ